MKKRKKILLLGAGFSANFGAPLAKQVWMELFNSRTIQQSVGLKKELLKSIDDYDFETYYYEITKADSLFSSAEQANLTQEIYSIFERMDQVLKSYIENSINSEEVSIQVILGFLLSFLKEPTGEGLGYIFSLNQDILVERLCHDYIHKLHGCEGLNVITPCFNAYGTTGYGNGESPDLKYYHGVRSDTELLLLKLHGSYDWQLTKNEKKLMIIGRNKKTAIEGNEILNAYMKTFKDVICQDDIDLITFGYSFSDTHINHIILEALNLGAKLLPIDIGDIKTWHGNFKKENEKHDFKAQIDLEKHLNGYIQLNFNQEFKKYTDEQKDFRVTSNLNNDQKRKNIQFIERFKKSKNNLSRHIFDDLF